MDVALRILGMLLMVFSLSMLPPALVGWIADGSGEAAFLAAFAALLLLGAMLWVPTRHVRRELRVRDAFVVTTLLWIVLCLAGAVPLMLASAPHMSFTDAVFESTSGLTTTGASVLLGLETLPRSILFYRAQLNWLGGMGIILLAVAILPMLGIGGMQLYKAEAPGPVKDKLTPRVTETAKALWYIYLALTVACAAAYWAGGMSGFDAITHSFSTLGTGGFSNYDASMAYFDSPLLNVIGTVFLFLAAINFALHYSAWRSRSLAVYWCDAELRFYVRLLLGAIALIALALWLSDALAPADVLHQTLFQVLTFSSNCGLFSAAYADWPPFATMVLLFLSIVGGCAGSSAGGMKALRVLLLLKQGQRELLRLVHPQAMIPLKLGERSVDNRVSSAVWGFFSTYVAVFVIALLGMMATGVDQVTAFSSVVMAINNLGLGLGAVNAGFGELSVAAKWILTATMLIGRLEVFTVLVLLSPAFWRR